MRNPRDFAKPLAVGAPGPLLEIPVTPSRMIHFFDPSNEKIVGKLPDLATKSDILLGNLEDAIAVENKEAARAGLVRVGKEVDLGETALWTRVNSLESPWVLDDITTLVTEIGHRLSVIMVPKVEGPWDIHYVDRLLAQLEARAGLERPILVHAILETALGVTNLEEIAQASPRMQGMSFGPADLAASRRMKTTRVGGGHPGYRVLSDPDPSDPEAPRPSAQQDLWHYSIGRMVDACTADRDPPVLRPVRRHPRPRGLRGAVPRRLPDGLRRRMVAAPGADRRRQEGLLPRPGRGHLRPQGDRGDPRRAGCPHDRRQDAGRRHLEAVPGDGRPRRDAGGEGPGACRGIWAGIPGNRLSMSLPLAVPDVASARRLGERACVVDAGGQFTAARQVDDLAAHAAVGGAREFVFDLGGVRRYETEALVELSALCRRLTSYGCEVIVAAHDPGVVLELRRLSHGDGWQIAPTLTSALADLFSRPI